MSHSEYVVCPFPDDGPGKYENNIHTGQSDQTPPIGCALELCRNGTEYGPLIDCPNYYV